MNELKMIENFHCKSFYLFSMFLLKKVIVSQRNVNQIAYTSILQFGENYGLGRNINEGFFLG